MHGFADTKGLSAATQAKQPFAADKTGFQYSSVDPSVARFLKGQAQRINQTRSRSIINVGKDLLAAKHYLAHGAFVSWVEQEVGMPARTAQSYMQVAQWVSGKNAKVAHLPASLLYILSAPSTPNSLILDTLADVEAGKYVAIPSVREKLKSLRCAKPRDSTIEKGKSGGQPVGSTETVDGFDPMLDVKTLMREVVSILLNGLSVADLGRIRTLLSDEAVRGNSELGNAIYEAISTDAVRLSKEYIRN
jgi:hypothetical protein